MRKLFRQEGTSFNDYLLFKRLERAHAALIAPVRPGQRYGKSPSDVRKDGA